VQGASDRRIILKELLPNIAPFAGLLRADRHRDGHHLEGRWPSSGLSVNPPTPSWGNMINEART
jgi:peptide/nickel transport system permease protein